MDQEPVAPALWKFKPSYNETGDFRITELKRVAPHKLIVRQNLVDTKYNWTVTELANRWR